MVSNNYIRYWRDKVGFTQQELGERAGIARNTVARLESGTQKGSIETITKIAQALKITIDEVRFGPIDKNHKDLHEYNPGDYIPGVGTMVGTMDVSDTIPLLTSIPAGQWKEWHDQYPPGFGEEKVPRYDVKGKHVIALRVHGDSMIGESLHEGDHIYIDPEIPFTATRGGRIGVVRFNGSYKIRRVFLSSDGQNYRLVPANPSYHEEEVPVAETTIFKIVKWMPNTEGMF